MHRECADSGERRLVGAELVGGDIFLPSRRAPSRRPEARAHWPRSIVKKLLNLKEDADQFSADDEEEQQDPAVRCKECRSVASGRALPESGMSHLTYTKELSVFVGTWNVAGKSPPQDLELKQWLHIGKEVDIYVIGFQEVVPLNTGNVFGPEDEGPATRWEALIRRTLNGDPPPIRSAPSSPRRQDEAAAEAGKSSSRSRKPVIKKAHSALDLFFHDENIAASSTDRQEEEDGKPYVRIISKQMVGILITVWVRKALRRYVHDVKVSCVGCGLMGYYGNKGSVSVSMMLEQTSFCFICSHLASGEKEADALHRNADVEGLLRRTWFRGTPGKQCSERALSHDRVIWLGDLNYRLSMSNGDTKPLVRKENWDALLKKDQLKVQQGLGGVFYGWREGNIDFAPTYKYKMNSADYSNDGGEKQRTPAWCDRILWHGNGLKLVDYYRIEYTFSDHRPVTAIFVAQAEMLKRPGSLEESLILNSRSQDRAQGQDQDQDQHQTGDSLTFVSYSVAEVINWLRSSCPSGTLISQSSGPGSIGV